MRWEKKYTTVSCTFSNIALKSKIKILLCVVVLKQHFLNVILLNYFLFHYRNTVYFNDNKQKKILTYSIVRLLTLKQRAHPIYHYISIIANPAVF